MSTVIFDFDSTLVSVESLETILAPKLRADPERAAEIREITGHGMDGSLDFHESLSRRLALAAPTRDEVLAFGNRAIEWLTPGMDGLVGGLLERGITVRIASGGIREGILPLSEILGIAPEWVHAVTLDWDEMGVFMGIEEANPFTRSKAEGVRHLGCQWESPLISVGDGMTDYQLFREGLVDAFVAFTGHVRRRSLVEKGVPEARDVRELARILEGYL